MEISLAHRMVLELVDDAQLQHKGYVVFTDNFYSSPALFRDFLTWGFGTCGTARKDRCGIPPSLRTTTLQQGG